MPKGGFEALLRGRCGDDPRIENAWRGQEGRSKEGRPESAGSRHGESPASYRECEEVRTACRRLHQSILRRYRRGDRLGQGKVQSAWRRSTDGRPLGDGGRGRG